MVHREHLVDTSKSVGVGQVRGAQEELHNIMDLGLRVHDQVLETDEEDGNITAPGIFHQGHHPIVDVCDTILDPPVEILGILCLVIKGALHCMIVHGN